MGSQVTHCPGLNWFCKSCTVARNRDLHGAPQRVVATLRRVGDALVEFEIEAANVAGVGGVSF